MITKEILMPNNEYYIGANDEHGQNPPTAGKRTPILPGLNRQIYENEFNRGAKTKFIEACLRQGFSVYDVKPEIYDISISERIRRINRQNLTALITFAYNAYGESFNSVSGVEVFYSTYNSQASLSQNLAQNIYYQLIQGTQQVGRGVKTLNVGVLSNVNCPSTLIEAGFMTNLTEAKRMTNPLFQTEVGEESCHGLCDYLNVQYLPRNDLNNYKLLRRGSSGNYVYLLQFLLNQFGSNLSVDGQFGTQTQSAVRNFQTNNNLSVDGIVGRNTWKTLLRLPPYPLLKYGDRGSYVSFAQRLLESNLIPVGNIDGIFGTKTQNTIKEFQSNNNLVADGIIGNNTWNLLARVN